MLELKDDGNQIKWFLENIGMKVHMIAISIRLGVFYMYFVGIAVFLIIISNLGH